MQKKDIRNPLTIVSYLLIKAARRRWNMHKLKAHMSQPGPATGDCKACERVQGRQSMPDFTTGLRVLEDFYDGKCDSAITEADTCHRS